MIFRSPTWLMRFLGIASLASAVGAGLLHVRAGVTAYSMGLDLVALLMLVGFADALMTRVELNEEGLVRVDRFRRRFVPRAQIDSVKWEAGAGVAIRLIDGSWLGLPDVGNSQARANSIRAWIKRTGR